MVSEFPRPQCDQASTRCAGTSPTYGGPTSCQENQKGPLLCHSLHGFCAGLLSPASLFPPPVITIHISCALGGGCRQQRCLLLLVPFFNHVLLVLFTHTSNEFLVLLPFMFKSFKTKNILDNLSMNFLRLCFIRKNKYTNHCSSTNRIILPLWRSYFCNLSTLELSVHE